MEITGTLKKAVWFNDHRTPNIRGIIYGDSKKRFLDGDTVYTSTVLEDMGNGLYRTKYSLYKVEFVSEQGRSNNLTPVSPKTALEMAEVEMRYAGWNNLDPENVGRKAAYEEVCKALFF